MRQGINDFWQNYPKKGGPFLILPLLFENGVRMD
jgi:hypothetical protein